MNIEVSVFDEMFRFNSEGAWVNSARNRFAECGVRKGEYICIDSKGRVCLSGREFMRASRDDAYPVTVYALAGFNLS